MKKIAGILLLAAVILTAGCISTADPIVGSWQTAEPIQYDGFTMSYLAAFEEDGTGEMIRSYSDESRDYTYPFLWEKTGDTYQYEMLSAFTFSEDGRTMTDSGQYIYTIGEGEDKFGSEWTEVIPGGADVSKYYTYIFNEDGTGVETIYETGEEPDAGPFTWEEYAENQIVIRYLYTYTFEDGKMKTSMGQNTVFEEVDGIWVETPQVGEEITTYEFEDDGICVRHIYDGETNELVGVYKYHYTPDEMQTGGTLESAYIYELEFLEDGTLQDVEYGEILERVSPA